MGLASLAIIALPVEGYPVVCAYLLIGIRIIQGIALGGEPMAAYLYLMESGSNIRKLTFYNYVVAMTEGIGGILALAVGSAVLYFFGEQYWRLIFVFVAIFIGFKNGQLVVICESDYGVKYAADLFYNRGRDNEDRVIYCDERALLQLRRFDNSVMIDFGRIDTPPLRHLNTFLMTVLKEEKTEKFPVLMESEYQKYLDNIWLPPEEDYYDEDTLSIPSSNLKKAFMKLLTKKRSPK
ncbi:unnamed protein product [Sphagnum jensenii]|uniref:Major facilitator superfamily (MFS) profile domain-containing protein n=1 Tax=Sphagnum jensenii TaxID=128206 RepID=A0ABP0V7Q0_9BRYO